MQLSSITARQNEMLNKASFSDLIPVLDYYPDKNLFLVDPAGLGFFIICEPSPGVSAGLRNTLRSIYTLDYPADTTINTSLVANRDLVNQMKSWSDIRYNRMDSQDRPFESDIVDIMKSYLAESIEEGCRPPSKIYMRNFEVWFSVCIPTKKQKPTGKEAEKVEALRREVFARLQGEGLRPRMATHTDWIRRMKVLFNSGQHSSWQKGKTVAKPTVPLREQIIEPGRKVNLTADGIKIQGSMSSRTDENKEIRVLNCYKRPDFVGFGDMYSLFSDWDTGDSGLFEDFMITMCVHYPHKNKAKNAFIARKGVVTQQAFGPALKFSEKLKLQYEDFVTVERELDQENHRIINAYLQISLLLPSNDKTNQRVEDAISYLERKGYYYAQDRDIALPAFLESLPLCHRFSSKVHKMLKRHETFTTKICEYWAPVYGSWKGNAIHGVYTGVSREGQYVSIDPFITDASFNIAVAARSGAGKSVWGGNLIKHLLSTGAPGGIDDGAQVFAIDAGGSYENLSHQFSSSQYIDFGKKIDFSLDPFTDLSDIYTDGVVDDDGNIHDQDLTVVGREKLIMIFNQLKIMASPSGDLTTFQSAMMLYYLCEMINKEPENSSVTRFAELLEADNDQRVSDVGKQLRPFTIYGIYGALFDRRKAPPINFDSRFIVVELNALKAQPEFQTVVLMAIIQQAQDAMFRKNDGRKRLFLLDEAWEYIGESGANQNNSFFAAFLEAGWRRFRKTRCAGVCITQQLTDYYATSTGKAILSNSPWQIILEQEEDVIDRLKNEKYIEAPDVFFNLMNSVRTNKGMFSECMIRFNGVTQIIRNYQDDKSMMIHSTDPADRALVSKFLESGYSRKDAISKAVEQKKANIHH